jgi:hypothetical protein
MKQNFRSNAGLRTTGSIFLAVLTEPQGIGGAIEWAKGAFKREPLAEDGFFLTKDRRISDRKAAAKDEKDGWTKAAEGTGQRATEICRLGLTFG